MMGWRRTIRRLPLAGAAVVGAAVGHSIAYLIVAPQGRARATLLAGTGHGYWSTAVAAEPAQRRAVGVAGGPPVAAPGHHLPRPGGRRARGQRPRDRRPAQRPAAVDRCAGPDRGRRGRGHAAGVAGPRRRGGRPRAWSAAAAPARPGRHRLAAPGRAANLAGPPR